MSFTKAIENSKHLNNTQLKLHHNFKYLFYLLPEKKKVDREILELFRLVPPDRVFSFHDPDR